MVLLHLHCSTCGRAYGAKRIDPRGNYCSASCKAKAYRARKKQAELAKAGTFSFELYDAVKMISARYGQDLEDQTMAIVEEYGANALIKAMRLVQTCLEREAKLQQLTGVGY